MSYRRGAAEGQKKGGGNVCYVGMGTVSDLGKGSSLMLSENEEEGERLGKCTTC